MHVHIQTGQPCELVSSVVLSDHDKMFHGVSEWGTTLAECQIIPVGKVTSKDRRNLTKGRVRAHTFFCEEPSL